MVACEQAKVDIVKVFGPEARPLISQLTTEGQHRGAVIAALQDRKRDAPEPASAAKDAAGAHSHEASLASCQGTKHPGMDEGQGEYEAGSPLRQPGLGDKLALWLMPHVGSTALRQGYSARDAALSFAPGLRV